MEHSSDVPLFGPLTCPACGITEPNDYLLGLNHSPDFMEANGGQCTAQRLVSRQLAGPSLGSIRPVVERRARELGLH